MPLTFRTGEARLESRRGRDSRNVKGGARYVGSDRIGSQRAGSLWRGPTPRRAFTLVELLMLLFLIGVVTSMAVPRFVNFVAHQRVEAAARRIVVDLALAQRRARSSSAKHKVRFDLVKSECKLQQFLNSKWEGIPHLDHPTKSYKVKLLGEPYNTTIVSADFGGDVDIIFDGYGKPDSGGSVVIQCGSYVKTITVDPDTGRASVQ